MRPYPCTENFLQRLGTQIEKSRDKVPGRLVSCPGLMGTDIVEYLLVGGGCPRILDGMGMMPYNIEWA